MISYFMLLARDLQYVIVFMGHLCLSQNLLNTKNLFQQ